MVRKPKAFAAAILAAMLALAGLWTVATAQSQDYKFEPVSENILVGKGIRVEVRLVGPDGKPVSVEQVKLTATRLDMGPDGMAMMDTPLTPVASDIPGVFAFETDITMTGRWALRIEAEVDGVAEPVKGEIIYTAVKQKAELDPAASAAGNDRKILYYRNPMGLADVSPVPKKDSMGMDYIPVYEDEMSRAPGTVRVSLDKVQRAGVRLAPVERRTLARTIRGAGMIMADESRLAVITAKFDGFVERLRVRTTGGTVKAGEPLLTVWVESAELLRKMADLAALRGGAQGAETAKRTLRLYDVADSDIAEIAGHGGVKRTITFNAPVSGTVLEKPALDGMRFSAGDMLFRIADLSTVWVVVEVAEQDLSFIRPGQTARLSLPSVPGEEIEGTVDFVYPELETATRSGKVRIIVPNPDGKLKLGQFAHTKIESSVSDDPVLAIPASAVIDDGTRQIVFVSKGEGRFEPRDILSGARAGKFVEVREGLTEEDEVVATGTFLIDAESNLQAALAAFTTEAATR